MSAYFKRKANEQFQTAMHEFEENTQSLTGADGRGVRGGAWLLTG